MTKLSFEVLEGKHSEEDGHTYKKGEIVTSHRDLGAVFPNKFRKVLQAPIQAPLTGGKMKVKIGGKKGEVPNPPKDARGTDVSASFKLPAGFEVFSRGDSCHVYVAGETDPILENLKKDAVENSIKKYLEE